MQLPIKESVQFKTIDTKANNANNQNLNTNSRQSLLTAKELNAVADNSNPIISQVSVTSIKFNLIGCFLCKDV